MPSISAYSSSSQIKSRTPNRTTSSSLPEHKKQPCCCQKWSSELACGLKVVYYPFTHGTSRQATLLRLFPIAIYVIPAPMAVSHGEKKCAWLGHLQQNHSTNHYFCLRSIDQAMSFPGYWPGQQFAMHCCAVHFILKNSWPHHRPSTRCISLIEAQYFR